AYNGSYPDLITMLTAVLFDFIDHRTGDRRGLILFGDPAFLQTPQTRDLKPVTKLLTDGQLGLGGRATAIGDALGFSVKRYASKEDSNRIVVLLTDGQKTAGNQSTDDALLLAREDGFKVYTK
ncbi:IMP dehydrogenase, partial [Pseudoalteromonas sp. S409]|uniref:VWA domain-containing protein n=1 Tax=Pseudoalteromonas sp. S409 TaxID=2066518 RepID=UPI001108FEE9